MWQPPDLEKLVTKLRSSDDLSDLSSDERELLAELVEKFGENLLRPTSRSGIAETKAVKVAIDVILQEAKGVKTEAAVAAAREKFGLSRTRVFSILKHWRPKLPALVALLDKTGAQPSARRARTRPAGAPKIKLTAP